MTARVRLVLVLIALLIPSGILAQWFLGAQRAEAGFDPGRVPPVLDPWVTTAEQRLSEEVRAMIHPDRYLFRRYENRESGSAVWTYVAFYRGRVSSGAHDPEICYPAQGWEIVSRRGVAIPMNDGGNLNATLLHVHKDHEEELALYWFQPVGRWPATSWLEQLLQVSDSVQGSPQFAFVRFSTATVGGSNAADLLAEAAQTLAPGIREALAPEGKSDP
jgi:EpsI family protein